MSGRTRPWIIILGFLVIALFVFGVVWPGCVHMNVKKIQTPSGATLVNRIYRSGNQFFANEFYILLPGTNDEEHIARNRDRSTSFDRAPDVQVTNTQGTWTVTIGRDRFERLKPEDLHQKWVAVEDS